MHLDFIQIDTADHVIAVFGQENERTSFRIFVKAVWQVLLISMKPLTYSTEL